MFHRNMMLKYYAPEEGAESSGGGGEASQEQTSEQTTQESTSENQQQDQGQQAESQTTPEQEQTETPTKTEGDKSKVSQVTTLVEAAGLDMKEVAKVAKENDGKLDLETMVALKEKHGDVIAELIADNVTSIHKEQLDAANKRDQEVYDFVLDQFKDSVTEEDTGKSVWGELSGWAKDNVSTEHRSELNKLLAQGGLAAKLAAQELVSAFKAAQGTQEFQEAELIEGDSTPKGSGGFISKSDYTRELRELQAKGHVYGESREIAQLDARRAKSIAAGH